MKVLCYNFVYFLDGLRRLFCILSMQQQEDEKSLMEVLLLADTQLWKSKLSVVSWQYLYTLLFRSDQMTTVQTIKALEQARNFLTKVQWILLYITYYSKRQFMNTTVLVAFLKER